MLEELALATLYFLYVSPTRDERNANLIDPSRSDFPLPILFSLVTQHRDIGILRIYVLIISSKRDVKEFD